MDATPPDAPDTPGPAADPAVLPVDLRDYVRFRDAAATRVRVFATPRLALDLWCLQPQQATGVLHDPERDTSYTVVGGRSWFVTDEGEIGLDPMGALLVRAGTVHGIDNRAPDPLIVLAVTSPPDPTPPDVPEADDGLAIRYDEAAPGPLRRALTRFLGGD
ncbi:hypothetical protein [Egicoccus halophilus]|nr:hypothetical protein [Egicoccus halophilus]